MAKVHTNRHASHGANLHVEDDEIDVAALDARAHVVAVGDFFDEKFRSLEHRSKFVAQGREITREQYRGHTT